MNFQLNTNNARSSAANRPNQLVTQNKARLAGDQVIRAAWRNAKQIPANNAAKSLQQNVTRASTQMGGAATNNNAAQARSTVNNSGQVVSRATANTTTPATTPTLDLTPSSQLGQLRMVGYDEVSNYATTPGVVDQDALSQYVSAQGGTPGEARGLFNAIDLDQSGALSDNEFRLVANLLEHYDQLQFDAAQNAINDENGVNLEAFSRFAQGLGLTNSQAQSLFTSIDRNDSGGLREAELDSWKGMFSKWLLAEQADFVADQPVEPPSTTPPEASPLPPELPPITTAPDDGVNDQLQLIQQLAQERESNGQPLDREFLDSFTGIEFTNTEFAEQTYDWAHYVGITNAGFSNDIRQWLSDNGAVDPSPSDPPLTVDNPPVQETYESAQEAINANNVPSVFGKPVDEFSVLDLPSGELVNPEDPSLGELTIEQAAQQALYIEYKEGVLNGSIPPDDVRAQYVDALEAKAALQGDYELIPYYEQPGVGNNTNRKYPEQGTPDAEENAQGQITYGLSQADAAKLIDEEALNAHLNELWNDTTIQGDYAAHTQKLIDNLGDTQKQFLATQLSNAINSPEYMYALEDMKASGLQEEATQMTTSNLSNLALLDPALAQQTQINLASSTIASELNAVLADPSKLELEDIELAIKDSIELTIQGLRSGFGVIRHSSQTVTEYIDYLNGFANNKEKVTALATVYKQLVIDAKNWKSFSLGDITTEQLNAALDATYIPANMRGGLTEFMTEAQRIGVWGSMSGAAMIASFGYKVGAQNALQRQPGQTDSELAMARWGAARDLISFGSVIGHVSKFGATVTDNILNYFSGSESGKAAWQFLGLDRTLPELYGTTSFLPKEMTWTQLWQGYDNTSPAAAAMLGDFTNESAGTLNTALLNADDVTVGALEDLFVVKAPFTPASTGTKIVGTVLKTLGTVTDLFGVADIVMGAIYAKQAFEDGDRAMVGAYSLQAISGALVAGAGVIGTATLVAPITTGLAVGGNVTMGIAGTVAAGMFAAGAVLSIAALAIMIGVSVHRKNKAKQQNTEEQTEFFSRLADQGVTQSNWAAKLEYLRYAWSVYGNDNPDPNQSYFDYQQAEWEHFDSINGAIDGSSLGRLSEDLHVYNDLTVGVDPNTVVSGAQVLRPFGPW